jgi:hypothetical protein
LGMLPFNIGFVTYISVFQLGLVFIQPFFSEIQKHYTEHLTNSDKTADHTPEPSGDHTKALEEKKSTLPLKSQLKDTAASLPAQSHKRTFSDGPKQNINEIPPTNPVPPPNKKAKGDPAPELT